LSAIFYLPLINYYARIIILNQDLNNNQILDSLKRLSIRLLLLKLNLFN